MKWAGSCRSVAGVVISALMVLAMVAAYFLYRGYGANSARSARVLAWLRDPQAYPEWSVQGGERCGEAPFLMPSSGFIGYLWGDSFHLGHRHQGIDIFGGTEVDVTPVYAAYAGYLSRLPDWKASVIIRIPDDPLHPGRQIWTYYTHMASPEGDSNVDLQFHPGTEEAYVEAGALLGYQGNFSGTPGNPVGVHLHFSIVLDDGQGMFGNELEIANTLDPTPYLGLPLNAAVDPDIIPVCEAQE